MRRDSEGRYHFEQSDLNQLVKCIDACFHSLEADMLGKKHDDIPAWVMKVHKKLDDVIFAPIKEVLASSSPLEIPYKAGLAFGLIRWTHNFMTVETEKLDRHLANSPKGLVWDVPRSEVRSAVRDELFKHVFGGGPADFVSYYKDAYRMMRGAYSKLSVSDAADYFRGLSDGLKGFDGSGAIYGRDRGNARLLVMMWMNWVVIDKLRNISKVHAHLTFLLGRNAVGELKRVEKICQGIGYNGAGPGRPKKERKRLPPRNKLHR